jgi:predicted PurR-regulated permease PerM
VPVAPPGRERMSQWLRAEDRSQRLIAIGVVVWIGVGGVVLAYVAWRLLWPPLAIIAPPLLVAALIVYALDPAVSLLERRRVPRLLATLVVYVLVLGVGAGLVAVSAPLVGSQIASFAQEAPQMRDRATDLLEQGAGAVGVNLNLRPNADGEEIVQEVADEAEAALQDEDSRRQLLAALGGLAGVATGVAQMVLLLLLGPVLAFYLLADLPRFNAAARSLVPPGRRDGLFDVVAAVGRVTGGYVRGQIVVALFVGVFSALGFALIGLPFWALVGIVAGVSNLVPFIGPIVGGVLGVAVALLAEGPDLALGVVVVMVVVQQLESQVVSPLVMGRTVKIHPLAVILAVLAGGALFGLPGLLLAVPATAAAKVIAAHLWQRHVPWASGSEYRDPRVLEGVELETLTARESNA